MKQRLGEHLEEMAVRNSRHMLEPQFTKCDFARSCALLLASLFIVSTRRVGSMFKEKIKIKAPCLTRTVTISRSIVVASPLGAVSNERRQ